MNNQNGQNGQNDQNGQNGQNEERIQACQALAGVLDSGNNLNEPNFNNQRMSFTEELQQAEFEGGMGLPRDETDILFLIIQNILDSLTRWEHFHNAWANNRRALINFMLASPAFEPIHEQLDEELLDEELLDEE
jgi:hypothetical protein